MAKIQKGSNVPQSTIDHFQRIPWCAALLSDPAFCIVNMSRTVIQPGDGHTLMAETWNTDSTIAELLSLYRPPDATTGQPGEIRRFYTFGGGMNAHPNLLHGGVIATILDSTMGNIVAQQMPELQPLFTVNLNVSYKKPVPTPGTIMVRAQITKVHDSRKVWLSGVVENGTGDVHATAEGLWLRVKPKL
ncbi:hypothetical protein LTR99_005848 [Exophiala xenobiotica]|uniref:Thioesterase domain-containing protein n=1 Tax=Vermiconidia calcicola TaxID=1690605 RepID=A0AAV9QG40_9PEZI|nr:hypothetical protein LTR92_006262 [Exophiala xenobiotica]KAK5541078.1 hypothetical protein LTR25_002855 [Vermiconidia calcicola]KAK5549429.1 hypothetical protein LTR23_000537 [Chaetothyriales sp. CCFEE 6169]KAK5270466.1 hypothetical protein LTR96_004967 [Exophiala xenobiotica]KAK5302891.1 hypothetical protein LTR99_005848 [Exophiala xenobiotica]